MANFWKTPDGFDDCEVTQFGSAQTRHGIIDLESGGNPTRDEGHLPIIHVQDVKFETTNITIVRSQSGIAGGSEVAKKMPRYRFPFRNLASFHYHA
jgi:hypothetical protein